RFPRSQHLTWIHDACRVEHCLDGAHQFDRHLVFYLGKLVALENADAVLGGDRSAHAQHDIEYGSIDFVPASEEIGGVSPDWLADIVMDVAVTKVSERTRRPPGNNFTTAASARSINFGNATTRTQMSGLIE